MMMEVNDPWTLSLGGANIADKARSESVQCNPAAPAGGESRLQVAYLSKSLGIWSGRLLGSTAYRGMTLGAYLSSYGYGEFKVSGAGTGSTGGTFDGSEHLLGVFAAGNLPYRLNWGFALKLGWWKIYDVAASAGAFDAGLLWDSGWEDLKLGIAARNVGSQLSASNDSESPLPEELSFGGARKLRHLPLTLHLAAHLRAKGEGDYPLDFLPGEPGLAFGAGGEFAIKLGDERPPLNLRIGYRSLGRGLTVGQSGDALAGFAFGLGFKARRVGFDYAFAPMGGLGATHRIGVTGSL